MDLRDLLKAITTLAQNVIGIPANLAVLLVFVHIARAERRLLPADIIVSQLVFVNLVLILSRGIPQSLSALDYRGSYNTATCKFLMFTYRTTRAMSIPLTFLLSAYQGVTITPSSSRLYSLKPWLSRCLLPLSLLFWLLDGGTSYSSILYTSQIHNITFSALTLNLGYCLVEFPSEESYFAIGVMSLTRDTCFILLMVLSSLYILLILYQHCKRAKGIRSSVQSQGSSAENRAAKTVVTLITVYVIFFGIDNLIWAYTVTIGKVPVVMNDVRVFFSTLYATVCPVVVIVSNKRVNRKLRCDKFAQDSQSKETTISTVSVKFPTF
ncbi:olfactory receptor class A-like protein 1 [Amia ocellicauda]|uniref:olfactory receptor class A-like protein 1 n=1 Tax=Amia ocellicauda TaxID=2972642 RepID=UPI003464B306